MPSDENVAPTTKKGRPAGNRIQNDSTSSSSKKRPGRPRKPVTGSQTKHKFTAASQLEVSTHPDYTCNQLMNVNSGTNKSPLLLKGDEKWKNYGNRILHFLLFHKYEIFEQQDPQLSLSSFDSSTGSMMIHVTGINVQIFQW